MDEELAIRYRDQAPHKVKVGRVIMLIGCILFFVAALVDGVVFAVAVANPSYVDWGDVGEAFHIATLPLIAAFLIVAGIGGICFIFDVGGRMRKFATLAAIVMLIVFIVDTVLSIRKLIRSGLSGDGWLSFLVDFLDIQLSGGLYLIGWALVKDFVGD